MSDSLQFDTALPAADDRAGDASPAGAACVVCSRAIEDQYFDVNGQSVCPPCREQLAAHAEIPRGAGPIGRALLFGGGAAVLGAALYYAVIAITKFEIGLVAIAIGYMVGYAIRRATKGRGGRRFQVMAVILTYWAVGLAYTPLAVGGARQRQETTEQSAPSAEASRESAESPSLRQFLLGAALLAGFTFALPVLVIAGSLPSGLISGAIIAFGMQQAWRMTGAPRFEISGPYRIGAAPSAVS
jgi:hypothetical protein